MKTAFYRLCAKHRTTAKIVLAIFLCGAYSVLLRWINAPLWVHLLVWLVLVFVNYIAVDGFCGKLLLPAMKTMREQCDPYPLLQELKEQATYPMSEPMRLTHHINSALAFRQIGEFEKALQILNDVHIDKLPSTTLPFKFIYYLNLTDIHHLLGHYDQAKTWNDKLMQIYQDLPDGKQKKQFARNVEMASAEALFRSGEFSATIDALNKITCQNELHRVEHALLYARCALALGDVQTARTRLQYVLLNGNRLFHVAEAKRIWDTL